MFAVEELDYSAASADQKKQIQEVYEYAFTHDLGLQFDASLDTDFVHPELYYYREVEGAYFVVNETNSDGQKRIVGTTGVRRLDNATIPRDCVFHLTGQHVCGTEENARRACELKRMFLLPCARGKGLSYELIKVALELAMQASYDVILLDTKSRLAAANHLYLKTGFQDCGNYNGNPRADRFLGKIVSA